MSYQGLSSVSTEGYKETRFPGLEDVIGTTDFPSGPPFIPSTTSHDPPLEVAINGNGFFQIQTAHSGIAYTREGSFSINSQGVIVTSSSYELYPRISMPSNRLSVIVASNGEVSVTVEGSTSPTHVGNIQLAKFVNPEGLEKIGANLYQATNASGSPETGTPGSNSFGTIVQDLPVDSSVSEVERIAAEIAAQRQQEMSSITRATL